MRIYVEYDKTNPDLVRVQHRNAALAIIPAGSIAVVGWLVGRRWRCSAWRVLEKRLDAGEPSGRSHQLTSQSGS